MKIKVCGMKYRENIEEVADLHPDYMGFIFFKGSPRYMDAPLPKLSKSIERVGVFVNASTPEILQAVQKYQLNAIQLHGEETTSEVKALKRELNLASLDSVQLFKVFAVGDAIDYDQLQPYTSLVDYFLFDTKGLYRGGNGASFDWTLLEAYPFSTPFILSGGIGLETVPAIKKLMKSSLPIHALDVNSRFETRPGLKSIEQLQIFLAQIKT